jgi:hypothetical protein
MKNIVLPVALFFMANTACKAQQTNAVDTFMTERTLSQLQKIFTLTLQQQTAFYEAGVFANEARRKVFANYWKTDSFKIKLARADYFKDSLYRSVLGDANMKRYRDTLLKQKHTW